MQGQRTSGQDRRTVAARKPIKRGHHHKWQAVIASLCVCVALVVMAMTTDTTVPWLEAHLAGHAPGNDSLGRRTGTIVVQMGDQACEIGKFDNTTGRTIDREPQCHSTAILEGQPVPVPEGTAHTLSAISKSFQGGGN